MNADFQISFTCDSLKNDKIKKQKHWDKKLCFIIFLEEN